MPLVNPKVGDQVVPLNNIQPSLRASDATDLVANWIQISNVSSIKQRGVLYLYGNDGRELKAYQLALAPQARADLAGHEVGPSVVGFAR